MHYQHTPERSTELLRQALPLMSRQATALHPVSYALWYAYVADGGSALREEVDRLLASQGKLDERSTEALYRRHVAGMDAATAQSVSDGLQQVIGGMSAQAALATDQTERYGHALERMVTAMAEQAADVALGRLAASNAAAQPAELVDELRQHTQQMQAHMAQLQQKLAESQREIELLRQEVQRARHDSMVDTLTGLANRRAFDQKLAEGLDAAQDEREPPCLLLADLDHFKRINDTYGHGFGDQVLRAVAQLLKTMAPAGAMVARVGGEEFALLLPDCSLSQARALAEKLRATVAANHIRRKGHNGAAEHVTLSLGAASWRRDEGTQAFFDRADRALYAAKSGGRDRVVSDD